MKNFNLIELSTQDVKQVDPLVLAFIGDSVYEQFVRENCIFKNKNLNATKLHYLCVKYVKASSQSAIMASLEEELTEEEDRIYKRGRNTKSNTVPKNAKLSDYRRATGFEALIGYVYLKNDDERLEYLLKKSVSIVEEEVLNGKH